MRRTLLPTLLALVVWTGPPAVASAVTVQLDGGEPLSVFTLLADGSIEIEVPGEYEELELVFGDPEEPEDTCYLQVGDDGLYRGSLEDCDLWGLDAAEWLSLQAVAWDEEGDAVLLGEIPLVEAAAFPSDLAVDEAEGGVILPADLAGAEAALYVLGGGWILLGPVGTGGFLSLDLELEDYGSLLRLLEEMAADDYPPATLRVRSPDGTERAGPVQVAAPVDDSGGGDPYDDGPMTGPGGPPSSPGPSGRVNSIEDEDRLWVEHPECPIGPDHRGRGPYVFCLDLSGRSAGEPWETRLPTDDFILRPNRAFVVYVRHNVGEHPQIAMLGARGLYFAGDKNLTESAPPEGQSRGGRYVPQTAVTRQQFSPRLPGDAEIDIRHNGRDIRLEFAIQPVYIGAIRVGLGMVFLTPEREYTIVAVPGSQTREIALATSERSSPVAAEIVIGFAPFVFQPHGRGYFGKRGFGQRLAPYIGLGLLQTRAEEENVKFSLLRSIYLGLEVELTATASLAATFVLGRTERLKQPYRVGGPIEQGIQEVPTTLGFMPGAAVVINFSPDFLRFTPIKPPSTP